MKKFSDKYLNDHHILYNAVVGFEFEFYSHNKSYFKLLEYLNNEFSKIGIKFWGFRKYHSNFKPSTKDFKIEPDFSMGQNGVELISGPLPYYDSKIILLKILKILQDHAFTNDRCSLHINISFDKNKTDNVLDYLNPLKMILNVDEDMIYRYFPERVNNIYAVSVKKLIPFKDYQFTNTSVNLLKNNLQLPDDTKYYGINLSNVVEGRLEFRYIGGKDYQFRTNEILELLDYFIVLTHNSINQQLDDEDVNRLSDYLSDNINYFKNFRKLDDFIGKFPTINLKCDLSGDYSMVKSQYDNFYNKLYDVVSNIYNLDNCIINFDTDGKRLEIMGSTFKVIFRIDNVRFFECSANNGIFDHCLFSDTEIKNSHLEYSNLIQSKAYNCKLVNCTVDEGSKITDCFFYGGTLNGFMEGGVFRDGVVGESGEISESTKIIGDDEDNYFNIKEIDIDTGKKGKEEKKKL